MPERLTPQQLACAGEGDEARHATGQLWALDGGISAQVQQMRI